MTAVISDSSGVIDTTYYRYYTPGDANGYTNGLKFIFNADSFARLQAAVVEPFTASDAAVAPYADNYFEYDICPPRDQGSDPGDRLLDFVGRPGNVTSSTTRPAPTRTASIAGSTRPSKRCPTAIRTSSTATPTVK